MKKKEQDEGRFHICDANWTESERRLLTHSQYVAFLYQIAARWERADRPVLAELARSRAGNLKRQGQLRCPICKSGRDLGAPLFDVSLGEAALELSREVPETPIENVDLAMFGPWRGYKLVWQRRTADGRVRATIRTHAGLVVTTGALVVPPEQAGYALYFALEEFWKAAAAEGARLAKEMSGDPFVTEMLERFGPAGDAWGMK